MESTLYKPQYLGKMETPLNIRNTINYLKATPACSNFRKYEHDIIKHAKLALIERLKKKLNASKDTLKLRLKR